MLPETVRNVLLVVLAIVAGVVGGSLAGGFNGADGIIQPSIGEASLGGAIVTILGVTVVAVVVGVLMSRASNPAVGLFTAGWAFFGLAWRMEPVGGWVLAGGGLGSLAVEGAVWAIAAGGAWWAILRLGGGLTDVEPTPGGDRPHPLASIDAARSVIGALAVVPVAWVAARDDVAGQAIGAAVLAGVGAGLASRLMSPHVQPYLIVPAVVIVGAAATGWTASSAGTDLLSTIRREGMPPLAATSGAGWASGAMLGVAMGLGWARTFLHHEDEPDAPAAGIRRPVQMPPASTTSAAGDEAASG